MSDLELWQGDCLELMKDISDESVDLVITSPPYDDVRKYGSGHTFDFMGVASHLWRVIRTGGVCVWVVNDGTKDGSETGTSFRHALGFMETGFRLHDTMIWNKGTFTSTGDLALRYAPVFEYMFVLSKGKPSTFNPIKDRPNKTAGEVFHGTIRKPDGSVKPVTGSGQKKVADFGQRHNIWEMPPEKRRGHTGNHPAVFPERLASDHIKSWSNPGDTVLDCFMGSGTTGVACVNLGRHFIGIEKDADYFQKAQKRILDRQEYLKREKEETLL